jgi:starch phosphorylase
MSQGAFVPRELPAGLEPLAELALDLRWTWSHQADHIWRHVDPETWEATRNPWLIIQEASRARLAALAVDNDFRHDLDAIVEARARYLSSPPALDGQGELARPVAYFSMEFGLGEAVPLYAGGLGVLAGDHLKAASDLGVPMIAVGLLYQEGYFRQALDAGGRQEELYPYNDPTALPIQPALAESGGWLTVPVELPGRTLVLRAWRAIVGRVTLYLLDTNVPVNDPADRGITGKLYGDGPEMRIRQEIVLGIGGFRLLDALGVRPGACHLNEGHAAFAVLERARLAMRAEGLSFAAALAATRAGNVFTTHTPVAAGFDAFPVPLVAKYFPEGRGLLGELGISLPDLLALGRAPGAGPDEPFRPAYLAVRGAGRINAVSALHGATSRELFGALFPRLPVADVPIGHVTNGVHVPSWDSPVTDALWTEIGGPERWRSALAGLEAAAAAIDDERLWSVRARARDALVGRVRERLARQLARRGAAPNAVEQAARVFDPDVLTVGFARRFAEYKRPNLLLSDEPRLRRLLTDPHRPVQLVVAGKAHPEDQGGRALVEAWVRFAADPAVRARCVFLEDHDLEMAQELVQGVDVWLNMPRRPWEACGTSGMKVLVNGGLNVSSLDGWWAEAYSPEVGWAIASPAGDDAGDAQALFRLLEEEIAPAFYHRDEAGLPRAWLGRVRASLSRLTPRFSANRMLAEYVIELYRPADAEVARRLADGATGGRKIEAWARRLTLGWPGIRFGEVTSQERDGEWALSVEVFFGDVPPADLTVELYAEALAAGRSPPVRIPLDAAHPIPGTTHGYVYTASAPADRPAGDYTPRVLPRSTAAALPLELPLVTWAH